MFVCYFGVYSLTQSPRLRKQNLELPSTMSRKKGVSAEDKYIRMKELFYETMDVFTMKQLEPLAYKQKGIISQAVKDLVLLQVADGIVSQDKIGVGTYFWAFPSANAQNLLNRKEMLAKENTALKRTRDQLKADTSAAQVGREESEERTAKLRKLATLQKQNEEFKLCMKEFADMDPDLVARLEKDAKIAREAANRWTDNIDQLKKFTIRNMGLDSASFHQSFDIPSDLEYLE